MTDSFKRIEELDATGRKTAFRDLTGFRSGRLKVLSCAGRESRGRATYRLWLCQCDCGEQIIRRAGTLVSNATRSCGCIGREWPHGHARKKQQTNEYMSWSAMIQRCNNVNNPAYLHYGGRGISVCERWMSFEMFYADMGPRPSRGYSLERIDNNGNYEPGNVRWATRNEQNRNYRRNKMITIAGEAMCASDWAARYGVNPKSLLWRLAAGWDPASAVVTPYRKSVSK